MQYKQRLVTADEAVTHIKDGNRVFSGQVSSFPKELEAALVRNKDLYRDVEIVQMFSLGDVEFCRSDLTEHFSYHTLYAAENTRRILEEKRADFTPCYLYRIPELFRDCLIPLDVAMVQLSMPDENGYCSFGLNPECAKQVVASAPIVLAELNDQYPYVYGDNHVHISQLDYIVETSYSLKEFIPPPITETELLIGKHCSSLIKDGDTLQLGIGGVPNAVLASLTDKKDLGIHSEMFSDGVVDLVEAGVITGARKTLHKGKLVATFLLGSKKLFDFVNCNEIMEMHPVDYVNNPLTIMKNENLVSINSCVEIDLTGQVASESIGPRQISGVGGQVDFIRGATLSPGGRSIIAMTSTARGGKVSRIVPSLTPGAFVTTNRHDVDYIATEYGIVRLFGLSLRKRAEALISIAHPDFREELSKASLHMYYPDESSRIKYLSRTHTKGL